VIPWFVGVLKTGGSVCESKAIDLEDADRRFENIPMLLPNSETLYTI
jgi:hypothetical protein